MKFLVGTLLAISLQAQVVPGRFIVELEGEPALSMAVREGNRAGWSPHRDRVRRSQESVRRWIEPRGRIRGSVEIVANALIVDAPGLSEAELRAVPGVRRVVPDREFTLELDRAIALHKVPDAWNRAGGEQNAGAGIKIAILDSGIDARHPGFQGSGAPAPQGFPKLERPEWASSANGKIVVVRSYEDVFGFAADESPLDKSGHGTAVAMVTAGVANEGPLGRITGVAPGAFLGSYKVFGGPRGDRSSTAAILRAIDDAVADGMDVINMSFGSLPATRAADDFEVEVVERVTAAGILVVKSAGNEGPEPGWISSPGTAPSGITVGATLSDRVFASAVEIDGGPALLAARGDNHEAGTTVRGALKDVASADPSGRACDGLPAGSLQGTVALILRGDCFFELKAINAEAAGAIGVVIYTDAARPDPSPMAMGAAKLPALMISHADGLALKNRLAESGTVEAALFFDSKAFRIDPFRVASFSSRGPTPDNTIKPDLTATGFEIYTAAQKDYPNSDVYGKDGYRLVDGTSFSSPLVAGAAAVLKSARPGLTLHQYRSLLINSAAPLVLADGSRPSVQHAGVGVLDLDAAVRGIISVQPTSVSFGAGGGTVNGSRELAVTNLGTGTETYAFEVAQITGGSAPRVNADTLTLAAGETGSVRLLWDASELAGGEYQGFVTVRGASSDVVARVPYWYGVPVGRLRYLSVYNPRSSVTVGTTTRMYIRLTDEIGLPFRDATPRVSAVEGGGTVLEVKQADASLPGLYEATVRVSDRPNVTMVFRVDAGSQSREVSILTTTPSP